MKTEELFNGKSITVKNIPADVLDKIDRQAAHRGETRSQYIRAILAMITESQEEADSLDREEKMFENIANIIQLNIDTLKKSRQTLTDVMDYLYEDEDGEMNE